MGVSMGGTVIIRFIRGMVLQYMYCQEIGLCACSIAYNNMVGVASFYQKVELPWPLQPPYFLCHWIYVTACMIKIALCPLLIANVLCYILE